MSEEQSYSTFWRLIIEKIVEAAGDYDAKKLTFKTGSSINEHLSPSPIVMYSFVDCPWYVVAKTLLREHYSDF
jgi:hypothetical protein